LCQDCDGHIKFVELSEKCHEPAMDMPGDWMPLAEDDIDAMRAMADVKSRCVWMTLLREAHAKESLSFVMSDAILADRSRMSLSVLNRRKPVLMKTGLVECEKSFPYSQGEQSRTRWTLRPSVVKRKIGA
jgi:hypothetical protein